ncbi:protein phosphatase 2C domain-containing protein [Nakamurella sp. A5-74]|uniref:Protein phosphatase 2C domain-containing protein n=1 Tax=Nakamurella sp. A5-74 TaxID=3158264 RepID=A0AAU8DPJ5_9ACTN
MSGESEPEVTGAAPQPPGAGSDDVQPAVSTAEPEPGTEPGVPTGGSPSGDALGTEGEPTEAEADASVGADRSPDAEKVDRTPVADAAPVAPWWPVAFRFNLAKLPEHGEDADPILDHSREGTAFVAVFDGMGGAGGTVYETPDGPRTGAYLASRAARTAVEQRLGILLDLGADLDGPATAEDLRECVEHALTARWAELRAPRSALRSKLLRALPTTMALASVQRRALDEPGWTCRLWWAGDSRVYALDPTHGLQQLTVDDIKDLGDAMANLRDDSIVSNAMSADTPFLVRHRTVDLTAPFLLVAATDGCFGYFRSPMHFEHSILAALLGAPDTESWSTAVQESIRAITGDDASMAVLGVGTDHDGFRAGFSDRLDVVTSQWVEPLDRTAAETDLMEAQLQASRERLTEQTAQLWARYKVDYQLLLGEPGPIAENS